MTVAQMVREQVEDFRRQHGDSKAISLYFSPIPVNLIGEGTGSAGGLTLTVNVDSGVYSISDGDPSHIKLFGDKVARSVPSAMFSGMIARVCAEVNPGPDFSPPAILKAVMRRFSSYAEASPGASELLPVVYGKKGKAILLNCETLEDDHIDYTFGSSSILIAFSEKDSHYRTVQLERRRELEQALELISKRLSYGRPVEGKKLIDLTINDFIESKFSLPPRLRNRMEHLLFENARVEQGAILMKAGDIGGFGHLMNRTHESVRDLYELVSPDLDTLWRIIVAQEGVYGCHAGGFKPEPRHSELRTLDQPGSPQTYIGPKEAVVALVANGSVESILKDVPALFSKRTGQKAHLGIVRDAGGLMFMAV